MKRILSFLLVLVLLLTLVPAFPTARAATGDKLIAITFDDGPSKAYTPKLLDGLKERGVNVTFFMLGRSAYSYQDIVARAYQDGHQIANHSYNHPELTALSNSEVSSQVNNTTNVLNQVCGNGTKYFFRAPYGSTNERVRSLIGMPLIYWSVDTLDWKYRNATTVKNNIVNNAHDGGIILLHDIHPTTIDGALAAIDILLDEGYELVTVTELFRRRGVTAYNGSTYSKVKPNGVDYGSVEAPIITATPKGRHLEVTMTAPNGGDIYYSMDGSPINQESQKYTGPFTVDPPCTLKAVAAYNLNGDRSQTIEVSLTTPVAAAPKFLITGNMLTITGENPDMHLFYTLDGSHPTESSTRFTAPIGLQPNTIVRAIAGGPDYLPSDPAIAYYSKRSNFYLDVFPNNWFCEPVDEAVAAGYMNGVGGYRFDPHGTLTRGQLVTILYRYAQGSVTQEQRDATTFTDLRPKSYYYDPVCWAYTNGIVEGYANNEFRPDRPVTREEMCKILGCFLTFRGKLLPLYGDTATKYEDYDKIHGWALPYIEAMTNLGLLQGDSSGRFNPRAGAERAQAATVMVRLANLEPGIPNIPEPTEPEPTEEPTEVTEPVEDPTEEPTENPEPSEDPTEEPTEAPEPSEDPTEEPTETPDPSEDPSEEP